MVLEEKKFIKSAHNLFFDIYIYNKSTFFISWYEFGKFPSGY